MLVKCTEGATPKLRQTAFECLSEENKETALNTNKGGVVKKPEIINEICADECSLRYLIGHEEWSSYRVEKKPERKPHKTSQFRKKENRSFKDSDLFSFSISGHSAAIASPFSHCV